MTEARPADPRDATVMITVRLANALREKLRTEACLHRTSINRLCISKLLQPIDDGDVLRR